MKPLLKLLFACLIPCFSTQTFAQKPYTSMLEGSLTQTSIHLGECDIQSLTLGYKISTIVGEPTVYLNVKWKGNSDCLSKESFVVFLDISLGGMNYYISAGGSADMIVGPGNDQWGNNPLAGSPSWDKVISKNVDNSSKNIRFISADEAKTLWKRGFNVIGAKLITKSGRIINF